LHSRWCLLQCHGDVETGDDGEGYDGNGDAACVRLVSSGQSFNLFMSSATLVITGSGLLVIKPSWSMHSSTNVVGTPGT
jgi:hypothetical protein